MTSTLVRHGLHVCAALGAVLAATPAQAQDEDQARPVPQHRPLSGTFAGNGGGYDLEIIYVNTPAHPTNVVPGVGLPFNPGSGTTNFVRPWLSPDGAHLAIEVDIDTGGTFTDDNAYLLDGALLLREGSPAPWMPAENVGTLDDQLGVNNLGQVLVTNNTSSTVNDDYVVLLDPVGGPVILAQEGGLVDPILPALAGGTWDDSLASPVLDGGLAGWEADGLDGGPFTTATDNVLVLGNTAVAQQGVTVPANQGGGATNTWDFFDFDDFRSALGGTAQLIQGDTNGATLEDDILVFNGSVVLQENYIIPGSSFVNPIDDFGLVKGWLDHAGNWYARGNNDSTEQDWVVRNGIVVATSDASDPIVPGSTEFWDDTDFSNCFFAFDGNANGAYLIGGVTSNPSDTNGVIVLDDGAGNRTVICRESDPVDLDGNGLFDDDRFMNTFGDDDVLITDDGTIYFTATLKDGLGTAVDQGFFRLRPCGYLEYGVAISPVNYLLLEGLGAPAPGVNMTLTTSGVTGVITVFAFSLAPSSFPLFGGIGLIDPFTLYPTTFPAFPVSGVATVVIPVPNNLNFVGQSLYFQSVGDDTTQPQDLALSNGLRVTFCPPPGP